MGIIQLLSVYNKCHWSVYGLVNMALVSQKEKVLQCLINLGSVFKNRKTLWSKKSFDFLDVLLSDVDDEQLDVDAVPERRRRVAAGDDGVDLVHPETDQVDLEPIIFRLRAGEGDLFEIGIGLGLVPLFCWAGIPEKPFVRLELRWNILMELLGSNQHLWAFLWSKCNAMFVRIRPNTKPFLTPANLAIIGRVMLHPH